MGEHKHYKESGKFSPVGAVLMVLATAVCGGLLFWLYLLLRAGALSSISTLSLR